MNSRLLNFLNSLLLIFALSLGGTFFLRNSLHENEQGLMEAMRVAPSQPWPSDESGTNAWSWATGLSSEVKRDIDPHHDHDHEGDGAEADGEFAEFAGEPVVAAETDEKNRLVPVTASELDLLRLRSALRRRRKRMEAVEGAAFLDTVDPQIPANLTLDQLPELPFDENDLFQFSIQFQPAPRRAPSNRTGADRKRHVAYDLASLKLKMVKIYLADSPIPGHLSGDGLSYNPAGVSALQTHTTAGDAPLTIWKNSQCGTTDRECNIEGNNDGGPYGAQQAKVTNWMEFVSPSGPTINSNYFRQTKPGSNLVYQYAVIDWCHNRATPGVDNVQFTPSVGGASQVSARIPECVSHSLKLGTVTKSTFLSIEYDTQEVVLPNSNGRSTSCSKSAQTGNLCEVCSSQYCLIFPQFKVVKYASSSLQITGRAFENRAGSAGLASVKVELWESMGGDLHHRQSVTASSSGNFAFKHYESDYETLNGQRSLYNAVAEPTAYVFLRPPPTVYTVIFRASQMSGKNYQPIPGSSGTNRDTYMTSDLNGDGQLAGVKAGTSANLGFVSRLFLRGRVFLDSNRDGVEQGTEPGISGIVIRLMQGGSQIKQVTVNSAGWWYMNSLSDKVLGSTTYQLKISRTQPNVVRSGNQKGPLTSSVSLTVSGNDWMRQFTTPYYFATQTINVGLREFDCSSLGNCYNVVAGFGGTCVGDNLCQCLPGWSPPRCDSNCNDYVKNPGETDEDCGGDSCPKCKAGDTCLDTSATNRDCNAGNQCSICLAAASGSCYTGARCASCSDGFRNQGESDIDVGGPCDLADDGQACDSNNAFCKSGFCDTVTYPSPGKCVSCVDGLKNGDESDVDCGGSCDRCQAGQQCREPQHCQAPNICDIAPPDGTGSFICANCTDGLQNHRETDVDCGGPCDPCGDNQACEVDEDCISLICAANKLCQPASCDDNVLNQDEANVDCGGPCPGCQAGQSCRNSTDCATTSCDPQTLVCATCSDGILNQGEGALDCGGDFCDSCPTGSPCLRHTDCAGGNCTSSLCIPTCSDGVLNNGEDLLGPGDCGGPNCDPCVYKCNLLNECSGHGLCTAPNFCRCNNGYVFDPVDGCAEPPPATAAPTPQPTPMPPTPPPQNNTDGGGFNPNATCYKQVVVNATDSDLMDMISTGGGENSTATANNSTTGVFSTGTLSNGTRVPATMIVEIEVPCEDYNGGNNNGTDASAEDSRCLQAAQEGTCIMGQCKNISPESPDFCNCLVPFAQCILQEEGCSRVPPLLPDLCGTQCSSEICKELPSSVVDPGDGGEDPGIEGWLIAVIAVAAVCVLAMVITALLLHRRRRMAAERARRNADREMDEKKKATIKAGSKHNKEYATYSLADMNAASIYAEGSQEYHAMTMMSQYDVADVDLPPHPIEIDLDEISVGKELGRGAFGVVFRGEWRSLPVAVKKLHGENLKPKELDAFMAEADIMRKLPVHPNVIRLYGMSSDQSKGLAMVTEFARGGSLDTYLATHKVSARQKISMMVDISKGVVHLHQYNVIHRDLGVRNLLRDHRGCIKVADFGLSRSADTDGAKTKTTTGPLRWMAPESLTERQYSQYTDSWTMGIVWWEIQTDGAMPYGKDISAAQVALRVCQEGLRLTKPPGTTEPLWQLMQSCWSVKPKSRPTAKKHLDALKKIQNQAGYEAYYKLPDLATLAAAASASEAGSSGTISSTMPQGSFSAGTWSTQQLGVANAMTSLGSVGVGSLPAVQQPSVRAPSGVYNNNFSVEDHYQSAPPTGVLPQLTGSTMSSSTMTSAVSTVAAGGAPDPATIAAVEAAPVFRKWDRKTAEASLLNKMDGSGIVRPSSKAGSFAVSYVKDGACVHTPVAVEGSSLTMVNSSQEKLEFPDISGVLMHLGVVPLN